MHTDNCMLCCSECYLGSMLRFNASGAPSLGVCVLIEKVSHYIRTGEFGYNFYISPTINE